MSTAQLVTPASNPLAPVRDSRARLSTRAEVRTALHDAISRQLGGLTPLEREEEASATAGTLLAEAWAAVRPWSTRDAQRGLCAWVTGDDGTRRLPKKPPVYDLPPDETIWRLIRLPNGSTGRRSHGGLLLLPASLFPRRPAVDARGWPAAIRLAHKTLSEWDHLPHGRELETVAARLNPEP